MANDIVTQAIERVASGSDLSSEEAARVLREVMEGRVGETQTAGFLIALRTKGETVDEVAGLAKTMRELALRVDVGADNQVDTAGTGGGSPSFNVSTTAALLAAAAGATVAKHGNRSATGRCGSADVLEALGARIDLEPGAIAECIADVGIRVTLAPLHHTAMRHVVPVRRELGVRTIFNLLGPLTNPAGARRQLIGVADPTYLETMAGALARLGVERALVVAGEDGLDESSTAALTQGVEVNGEHISRYTLAPADVGVAPADARTFERDCAGGSPAHNAGVTRAILDAGTSADASASRELAVINAGAAIYAAGGAGSLAQGVQAARAAIADGSAARALERYVRASIEFA